MSESVISRRSFPSPFGFITITAEEEKITSVELCKKANSVGSSKVLEDAAKQLDLYLKGKLPKFSLQLKVSGTPFQLAVWKAIAKVPFGKRYVSGTPIKRMASRGLIGRILRVPPSTTSQNWREDPPAGVRRHPTFPSKRISAR